MRSRGVVFPYLLMVCFTELMPKVLPPAMSSRVDRLPFDVLPCLVSMLTGPFIILRVKEGCPREPFDEGALTLRTICRRFEGEGACTMSIASYSMLSPRVAAIDSKSASFSAAC